MYYLCSENKGADQLRSYFAAFLRLCVSHIQKAGFLILFSALLAALCPSDPLTLVGKVPVMFERLTTVGQTDRQTLLTVLHLVAESHAEVIIIALLAALYPTDPLTLVGKVPVMFERLTTVGQTDRQTLLTVLHLVAESHAEVIIIALLAALYPSDPLTLVGKVPVMFERLTTVGQTDRQTLLTVLHLVAESHAEVIIIALLAALYPSEPLTLVGKVPVMFERLTTVGQTDRQTLLTVLHLVAENHAEVIIIALLAALYPSDPLTLVGKVPVMFERLTTVGQTDRQTLLTVLHLVAENHAEVIIIALLAALYPSDPLTLVGKVPVMFERLTTVGQTDRQTLLTVLHLVAESHAEVIISSPEPKAQR